MKPLKSFAALLLVACLVLSAHRQTFVAHVFDLDLVAYLDAGGMLSDICGAGSEDDAVGGPHCALCLPVQALPGSDFQPELCATSLARDASRRPDRLAGPGRQPVELCNRVRAPPATV